MKSKILTFVTGFIGVVGILAAILVVMLWKGENIVQPGAVGRDNTFTTATSTAVTVSHATSTQVLARATGQRYYAIIEDTDANDTWCSFGVQAVVNQGILLKANGGSYEILPENNYIGAVNCISTNSASSVLGVIQSP